MKLIEFHEPMFEMAKLSRQDSNLPYEIWLDSAGKTRNVSHNKPRVKISVDNKLIPVSISDSPEILIDISKYSKIKHLNTMIKFISMYSDILLDHWNGKYTDRQVLNIFYDICHGVDKDTAVKKNAV